MSLATRCTECGTVFRVVQAQWKVTEGWVHGVRCAAVFNALENLCELEADGAEQPPHRHESAGHDFADEADGHEPTQPFEDSVAVREDAGEPAADSLPPMTDDGLPAAIVSFSS